MKDRSQNNFAKERKMRILHYALGFPPYRTGGLTKFCMDLMVQQNIEGHKVALMWPGQMGFVLKKVSVKDRGMRRVDNAQIHSFEVINPLPVSYDEGIKVFSAFTNDDGKDAYLRLLELYKPDVIHVHTLMGLHKSFLVAAKERNVRLIFTAHDFFPICPKMTMFRRGRVCSCIQTCDECGTCNKTALGIKNIRILQSPIYRQLKDTSLVKKLRKKHRDGYLSESMSDNTVTPVGSAKDFLNLREHYCSLLKLMDVIHYNSSITKNAYALVFDLPNKRIVAITHADIGDHRKLKKFSETKLRIRYLGPQGWAKGFFY